MIALLLAVLPCPPTSAASARPIPVTASALALNPEDPSLTRVGRLEFLAGFELTSDDETFGGLSGLLVEGERALFITDRGDWIQGRLSHDATGRLTGIAEVTVAPMLGFGREKVAHSTSLGDAEAVARLSDGSLMVGFEQRHRLWLYRPGDDPANARPVHGGAPRLLKQAKRNGGIEALEEVEPGRLLALTESLRGSNGDLLGFYIGQRTEIVRLVSDGAFVPTDLARLPSGDMLLLERRFSLLGGVAAQLRLIPSAQLSVRRLRPKLVARLERPLNIDNFEGLAVAEQAGETMVYIVSDDNFSVWQRTLLLQFRLLPE
ncbi:MAG: esterase-like activity of phytase family protein [Alphaproteobacteria bacterium]